MCKAQNLLNATARIVHARYNICSKNLSSTFVCCINHCIKRKNSVLFTKKYQVEPIMKFLECPYCQKKATSFFNLGNSFFLFSKIKKCEKCKKNIGLNLNSFFEYIALGSLIGFIYALGLLFLLGWIWGAFTDNINVVVFSMLWFVFVVPMSYFFPYLLGEYFHKRLFEKKSQNSAA